VTVKENMEQGWQPKNYTSDCDVFCVKFGRSVLCFILLLCVNCAQKINP